MHRQGVPGFPFTSDNKRYHTLAFACKARGVISQKAIVDIGCGCPNADGTKGIGGCLFCDGSAAYFTQTRQAQQALTVTQQLERERARIWQKKPGVALTAYFQSGTNTYLLPEKLYAYLRQAAAFPGVIGVSLATRPDCISAHMLDMLTRFAKQMPLTVELGLQTVNDATAQILNRCYPYTTFVDCFQRLREAHIRICVHLINGLPGETKAQMLQTAATVGALQPDGLKIQLLHVLQHTALATWYAQGRYTPMTLAAYVDTVIGQLERIPARVVIERITGDGDKQRLIAPLWSKDKLRVLGAIDKKMKESLSFQGILAQ